MSGRAVIIGSSFIGAMIHALRNEPSLAGGYRFDFAGAAGSAFADVRLKKGRLVNTVVSDLFEVAPVDDYDALFVYANLPSVHHLAHGRRGLEKRQYSSQAIDVALTDWVAASDVMPIYRRLKAETRRPVSVLSANASSTFGSISDDEYRRNVALLRQVLGDDYVETPRAAFTADLRPNADLYKGSVTIAGRRLDDERQARHDVSHLNVEGGKIILAALVARLRALDIAPESNDNEPQRISG